MDTHHLLLITLVFGLCAGFLEENQGFRQKLVKKFVFECTDKSIRCPNEHNNECLPASWGCDGITDCEDGADELDCDGPTESLSLWKPPVEESESVPYWNSHLDTSDSDNSPLKPDLYVCKEDSIRCKNPKGECIPGKWRCDRLLDCDEGEDEADCDYAKRAPFGIVKKFVFECTNKSIRCPNEHNSECLPASWGCDGITDCEDGADEMDCDGPTESLSLYKPPVEESESDYAKRAPFGIEKRKGFRARDVYDSWSFFMCNEETFNCTSVYGHCIPGHWACDGMADCNNGMDEANCPTKPSATTTSPSGWQIFPCTAEAFRCQNPYGECMPASWKCDGVMDCYDYEDEQDCYRKRSTKVNHVRVKKALKARRPHRQH